MPCLTPYPNIDIHNPTCPSNLSLYSRSNIGLVAISSHSSGGRVTFVSQVSSGNSEEGGSSSPLLFKRSKMLYADEAEADGLFGLTRAIGSAVMSLWSLSLPLSLLESRSSSGLLFELMGRLLVVGPSAWAVSLRCCSGFSLFSRRGCCRGSSPYSEGNLVRNRSLTCGPVRCAKSSSGSFAIRVQEKPYFL